MEVIVVAVIVSVVSPMILGVMTNRQRRVEKREDWARQDAVAAQAAEAANLLLLENRKVAAAAQETHRKLDEVHVLVNSDMTSALRAQLVALRSQVVVLHKYAGDTTQDETETLEAAEAQIVDLEETLTRRGRQQKLIDQAEEKGGHER